MYDEIIRENREWIDSTFEKLDRKLSKLAVKSRHIIPFHSPDGKHDDRSDNDGPLGITWWTNGFWGGLMWLMYHATGNEEYKTTAKVQEKLMDRAFTQFDMLHHDVGFMWHILSGASYRLTGDTESRNRNLIAAGLLSARYNLSGGFIRAWNGDNAGWTIIDCMMNIPLLYWASDETGDSRYRQVAMAHADMAMRDHVRPDGSVVHICVHDPDTGELLETKAGQGYAVGSCWSRGQGWGLYGFILSYLHTGKQEYLDTAKKLAHYYIANAAVDGWLPRLDFRQPEDPLRYDATAGVICACGLIEIAKVVPEHEQKLYLEAAVKTLRAMEKWYDFSDEKDGILMMGSGSYNVEVHNWLVYGDYYLAEAILKLKGSDFLPW